MVRGVMIGVSRIMAAAIEQNHDEYGIVCQRLAPFQVAILPLNEQEPVVGAAEQLYRDLTQAGLKSFWTIGMNGLVQNSRC